jgi:hypothetical protein
VFVVFFFPPDGAKKHQKTAYPEFKLNQED